MRSQYADKFNHDADAPDYDQDVLDESDPIRAGYAVVLDWIADQANGARSVLELGAGTGNLTRRLSPCERLVCVDVSPQMLRIARGKLAGTANVQFVETDILEYFDGDRDSFDAVVSSYAIHHLTESEKALLFRSIGPLIEQGGVAVFGDLMFENGIQRARYLRGLRDAGRGEPADDIEDEFFWDLETAIGELRGLGLEVTVRRFSDLSWGVAARGTAVTGKLQ